VEKESLKKTHTIVIEPKKGVGRYWKEIWEYRELFMFLAWRDILVRYKQTVIGIAWSIIRPFLTMVVLTVVFGKIANLPNEGVPYPILVYSALLPWNFFANSFSEVSNSLLSNGGLLSKIYFPRLIAPASSIVVNLVDTLVSFLILFGLMIYYKFTPSINIVFLPVFFFLAFVIVMGAGTWIGALNVKYRDFRYVVPFIIQFGLYVSPVGFTSSAIPENLRFLYSLNPMVGVIDGVRWAILGGDLTIYWPGFWVSVILSVIVFVIGISYFRKTEKMFADVI